MHENFCFGPDSRCPSCQCPEGNSEQRSLPEKITSEPRSFTIYQLIPSGINKYVKINTHTHTHTHARLTAVFPGLPGWATTRKVKPIWILLKQQTVSGSGIGWAMQVCTSLQIDNHASTPPLSFYRPDALPATNSTAKTRLVVFEIKKTVY